MQNRYLVTYIDDDGGFKIAIVHAVNIGQAMERFTGLQIQYVEIYSIVRAA